MIDRTYREKGYEMHNEKQKVVRGEEWDGEAEERQNR